MGIKKLVITGATGFIGSHLLEELIKKHYDIVLLKRSTSDCWRICKTIELVDESQIYDVDKVSLDYIFTKEQNIDCIIHLATRYIKDHSRISEVREMILSNILFPSEILENMRQNNIKYFINTGTFFEYEPKNEKICENSKKRPYNLYAATKSSFSNILKYYSDKYDIKSLDLKLFYPYGPKDNFKLIPYILKNLLERQSFEMTPSEQRLNFTYVKDIVRAYILSLDNIEKITENYIDINIGHTETHTIKEIIEILEQLTGRYGLVSYTKPYPKNEIFYVNCENKKAEKLLGWKPRYDIYSGLKETYNYYLKVWG